MTAPLHFILQLKTPSLKKTNKQKAWHLLEKQINMYRSLNSLLYCCPNVFGMLEGWLAVKYSLLFCHNTSESILLNTLRTKKILKCKFHGNDLKLGILHAHSMSIMLGSTCIFSFLHHFHFASTPPFFIFPFIWHKNLTWPWLSATLNSIAITIIMKKYLPPKDYVTDC